MQVSAHVSCVVNEVSTHAGPPCATLLHPQRTPREAHAMVTHHPRYRETTGPAQRCLLYCQAWHRCSTPCSYWTEHLGSCGGQEHQRRGQGGGAREEGLEQTAEKGPGDAVGGREHGRVWPGAGFRPKPLGAKSLSCSSANSPETRASLETPVSVSHPHLVSRSTNTPHAQPWAGMGSAGDTVVTTAPLVLPSQDSQSSRGDRPRGSGLGWDPRAHLAQAEHPGGLPGGGGVVRQVRKQ